MNKFAGDNVLSPDGSNVWVSKPEACTRDRRYVTIKEALIKNIEKVIEDLMVAPPSS